MVLLWKQRRRVAVAVERRYRFSLAVKVIVTAARV